MGDGNESACCPSALRKLRPGFAFMRRFEIQGQAGGHNVPQLSGAGFRGVKFGTDQRGEIIATKASRVIDWEIEVVHEMLREHQKIIARIFISRDDIDGGQGPIRLI